MAPAISLLSITMKSATQMQCLIYNIILKKYDYEIKIISLQPSRRRSRLSRDSSQYNKTSIHLRERQKKLFQLVNVTF